MKTVVILPTETTIKLSRLAALEAKERSHDAYMGAMRRMRVRQYKVHGVLAEAYAQALHDFAEMIIEEGRNGD